MIEQTGTENLLQIILGTISEQQHNPGCCICLRTSHPRKQPRNHLQAPPNTFTLSQLP